MLRCTGGKVCRIPEKELDSKSGLHRATTNPTRCHLHRLDFLQHRMRGAQLGQKLGDRTPGAATQTIPPTPVLHHTDRGRCQWMAGTNLLIGTSSLEGQLQACRVRKGKHGPRHGRNA